MDENQRNCLLRIARCTRFMNPGRTPDGCSIVVNVQAALFDHLRQVPEPWRGSPFSPLLFVSSNPSIDPLDDSPLQDCEDEQLEEYFESGFPDCFPKIRLRDGTVRRRAVQFWSFLRGRAAELWGLAPRALVPGLHFAITELVHCKSEDEIGVEYAIGDCMRLHWNAVLSAMSAPVIVVLGSRARRRLRLQLGKIYSPAYPHPGLEGRWALSLPHANAWGPKTFHHHYQDRLAPIQDALQATLTDRRHEQFRELLQAHLLKQCARES